jgi:two-component system phosphate regulon sensor histidine kinase PhoR
MISRPEIGLLTFLAIIAITALGIIVQAPIFITLAITGLFAITAYLLHKLSSSRASKAEARFGGNRKVVRQLDSWINVIDALPVACALIDRDTRVIHANERAQDLATIDKIGLPLSSFLRGSDIVKALERAQAGYSTQPVEILKLMPEERYLRVTLTTASLVRPSNGQGYLLAVIENITEDRVSQMQKAEFLANASHELKTPIASLLGYIETLKHHAKDDPDARERFLGIMQNQAERMVRLIDDLLSLRKIEQIEHIAPEDMVNLHQSVKAAMEAVKPMADKRGVTLSYKGPETAMSRAVTDETVQLFLNLIDNAVKFTPRGESVKIKLSSVRDWSPAVAFRDSGLPVDTPSRRIAEPAKSTFERKVWQIQIRDKGPGFAREHLPRIGERFYRIAGDLSSKEKGTGLGLAIVKHIIIRHRAGLYIRSQRETGTEFTVVLPHLSSKTKN